MRSGCVWESSADTEVPVLAGTALYTYDDNTMDEALLNESFDVARWLRAQTPPCPLSHLTTSDEAVELEKLGLVEIWDWLAQVSDELSNETLRQKQQGEINEPTYVQTKIRLEDLATRFTMAKRKRNWEIDSSV